MLLVISTGQSNCSAVSQLQIGSATLIAPTILESRRSTGLNLSTELYHAMLFPHILISEIHMMSNENRGDSNSLLPECGAIRAIACASFL
jgi:hypothetical protein